MSITKGLYFRPRLHTISSIAYFLKSSNLESKLQTTSGVHRSLRITSPTPSLHPPPLSLLFPQTSYISFKSFSLPLHIFRLRKTPHGLQGFDLTRTSPVMYFLQPLFCDNHITFVLRRLRTSFPLPPLSCNFFDHNLGTSTSLFLSRLVLQ